MKHLRKFQPIDASSKFRQKKPLKTGMLIHSNQGYALSRPSAKEQSEESEGRNRSLDFTVVVITQARGSELSVRGQKRIQ